MIALVIPIPNASYVMNCAYLGALASCDAIVHHAYNIEFDQEVNNSRSRTNGYTQSEPSDSSEFRTSACWTCGAVRASGYCSDIMRAV